MSRAISSRRRFTRGPLALATLFVVALACEPMAPPARLFLEDFEDLCDDLPCGWARVGGRPEQATWVETIHPGEHAIRLEEEIAIRSTDAHAVGEETATTTAVSVRLAARCDMGARLRVDVVLIDAFGAQHTTGGDFIPDATWSRVARADFELDEAVQGARVDAVVIRKTGTGVCEVGELVVDVEREDYVSCE